MDKTSTLTPPTTEEDDADKVPRNWRILKSVDAQLQPEAVRLGFGKRGVATFINNLLTRYFKGEMIVRNANDQ